MFAVLSAQTLGVLHRGSHGVGEHLAHHGHGHHDSHDHDGDHVDDPHDHANSNWLDSLFGHEKGSECVAYDAFLCPDFPPPLVSALGLLAASTVLSVGIWTSFSLTSRFNFFARGPPTAI